MYYKELQNDGKVPRSELRVDARKRTQIPKAPPVTGFVECIFARHRFPEKGVESQATRGISRGSAKIENPTILLLELTPVDWKLVLAPWQELNQVA